MNSDTSTLVPFLDAPVSLRSDLPLATEAEVERLKTALRDTSKPNTRRAYAGCVRRWEEWCLERGGNPETISTDAVALFLVHLTEGHKMSTVQLHLAALSWRASQLGLPNPRSKALWKLLMGLSRGEDKKRETVAKRTALLLLSLTRGLPSGNSYLAIRDRALLLLGFAGAFRRDELVHLRWDQITWVDGGIILHLHDTKTELDSSVSIPYAPQRGVCPVQALKTWQATWEGRKKSPWVFPGRKLSVPLSALLVGTIVKACAEKAGLDPKGYGAHSLRAGFITEAAGKNVPSALIMKHSRHKDLRTFLGYVRPHEDLRDSPVHAVFR